MKSWKRRFIAMLLTVAMAFTLLPTGAFAASAIFDGKKESLGTVLKAVGETGYYQRMPRLVDTCTLHPNVVLRINTPAEDAYGIWFEDLSDNTILSNRDAIVGSYKSNVPDQYGVNYYEDPCFEYDYTAAKPGITTVDLKYEYTYNVDSVYEYCWRCNKNLPTQANYNTYYSLVNFIVKVYANYTLNYSSDYDIANIPAIQTNNEVYSTTSSFVVRHGLSDDEYEFKGWKSEDGKIYQPGDTVTLEWNEADGANVSRTLTAVWEEKAPEEQTYTLT